MIHLNILYKENDSFKYTLQKKYGNLLNSL